MPGRTLRYQEQQDAVRIFSGALNYTRIRIFEQKRWPGILASISTCLTKSPPVRHNAVALGNWLFFSRSLQTSGGDDTLRDMSWLMHELTHAWQYQHIGLRYIVQALAAQLKLGSKAYDYGGEAGLLAARARGQRLVEFNVEQQADIVCHFYARWKRGEPCDAWLPFLHEINPHILL